jgi:DNA-binding response OmpR family regulator
MLRSPGWVHRDGLEILVWGDDHGRDPCAVRLTIFTLRRALGEHAGMVQNRRGFGYRITAAGC